jgi:hypothetical protein
MLFFIVVALYSLNIIFCLSVYFKAYREVNGRMAVNNLLERMWKEVVVDYFTTFQNLPGATEEKYKHF